MHCRLHKSPLSDRVHNQLNQVHVVTQIHFNIILPSAPRSPKLLFTVKFSDPRENRDYFLKQRQPVDLCNGEELCFLCGTD
jgi:hypothetical protein